ncbi:thiol:disulfide interchange protein DsbG [Pigmentiphaga litoralis]|uniref:thiol:disulfide interchange protein DsbG n=1 Tax=Pigmentiphaga litoralis TaxID=516702 RepID=UPI00389A98F2
MRHGIASLLTITATCAFVAPLPGVAADKPAVITALEGQGIEVVGPMPASGGLTGWAAHAGGRPVALYLTPDGKHVIAGTMLDVDGQDVTKAALQKAVAPVMSAKLWQQVEQSAWIADGKANAPRVVYVFTDPNCPYCNKLWSDARPWVDAGRVQLRHVIVGILTPTSPGKAAALLAAADPVAALRAHESAHVASTTEMLKSGQPKPLEGKGLAPLKSIPAAISEKLNANQAIMATWGLHATPAVVWRDEKGAVQSRTGIPPALLPQIMGPL